MALYDYTITVFFSEGRLFLVLEAVLKGNTSVSVYGTDTIILGVEMKSTTKLQDSQMVKNIVNQDNHIALACTGLKADVHVNKARIECQSHRLTVEDPGTIEYITQYIAGIQQKYIETDSVRLFGLSKLIIGFDPYTGMLSLY